MYLNGTDGLVGHAHGGVGALPAIPLDQVFEGALGKSWNCFYDSAGQFVATSR
jgi:hypothetical protein